MPRDRRPERPAGTAASDVDAAGAVAGNAGVTADSASAQVETALDVNENEATTSSVVRGIETSQDLASVLKGTLAGHLQLGLLALSNAVALSNRCNNDAQSISQAQNAG